jgi:hypothetical protein
MNSGNTLGGFNYSIIHYLSFKEVGLKGPSFIRCTKILSQCHPFLFFLPSPFLLCKNTFMDDYDGI